MRVSDLVPWRERRNLPVRRDDPFYSMQREVNRLFEDFVRGLDRGLERGSELAPWSENGMDFSPSVNLSENEDELEATFELPGMSEDDVEVSLTRDGLVVSGEKRSERSEEDEARNFFHQERRYGYFRRVLPLPPDLVDRDKVSANFENGVLTVRMPKRDEARDTGPRRITVQRG